LDEEAWLFLGWDMKIAEKEGRAGTGSRGDDGFAKPS